MEHFPPAYITKLLLRNLACHGGKAKAENPPTQNPFALCIMTYRRRNYFGSELGSKAAKVQGVQV